MSRKFMIAGTFFALGLGFVTPVYWRASSRSLPAANAGFQQGQRVTVQLRRSSYSTSIQGISLFGDGGCPTSSTSGNPNTPSITVPLVYECKEEKISSGQAVVNFPTGSLAGTLDSAGDLALDAPVTFTGRAEITAQISSVLGDTQRFLELDSIYPCPKVSQTQFISSLPRTWSATYSCSVNKLRRDVTTGNYYIEMTIKWYGRRISLDSRVSAVYASAMSCPAPSLQNGLAGPAQGNPPVKLQIDARTPITATDDPVKILVTARKQDGTQDMSYGGIVDVSLEAGSTPKIGCLGPRANCSSSLSLPMQGGQLEFLLQTPLQDLAKDPVIRIGDTALQGKAVIKAVTGCISETKTIDVNSPLDLRIDRVEVQQGVKQPPTDLSYVRGRPLLVRVFLDANDKEFNKYSEIRGITAKLIAKDKSGNEITGSPFTLDSGAFRSSLGEPTPSREYVFYMPKISAQADGADSLNHLTDELVHLQEQVSLEAKLDDRIPDRNPGNNTGKPLGPLTLLTTRPAVSVLVTRLRILDGATKTEFPTREGIEREMAFIKQAWPTRPERLIFVEQPDETQTTVPLAGGDPLTFRNRFFKIGFWLSALRGIRYVYFVDEDYFPRIRENDWLPPYAGGIDTNGITQRQFSYSVANSNRCARNRDKCGTLAHEMGHQFGLDDTYDSLNKRGDRVEDESFCWFHQEFTPGLQPVGRPYAYFDFMGNGGLASEIVRTWTDRKAWDFLKPKLLFPRPSSSAPPAEQSDAGNFVIVGGRINKNGVASFDNCYTLTLTDPQNIVDPGAYALETLDANAAVLSSLNFTPEFALPHLAREREQADFSVALPFSNAVRQIRLRLNGATLATRAVSANAPTARFLSDFGGQTLTGAQQVSWTGGDSDGDALTYDLFYSPDGQLRIPLIETTATSYAWKTDDYPSGPTPTLTLVATDGVNATVVDSRPFTLPNRPPRITIYSPGDQFQFKAGEPVTLEGSLFDPEEDLNLNPPLQWSSNLRGALGTGKQITVNNLQAGTHLITASGADSQGARGSASITVIVRPDNFSNLVVAQPNLDFGSVAVGLTRDQTLLVNNTGNVSFTVNAITSGNARFSVTAPAAPFTVAARSQQEVRVRFTPLAAGDQSGALTIAANASNRSSLDVPLTGKATGATARAVATVSAASFSGQTLAAESIVAAFGVNLATGVVVSNTLPLPTSLAGTTVRVRDSAGAERLAPLFFVAPQQINYLIPPGTATGAATITVTSGDGSLSIGAVNIAAVAPGLFTANANGQGVVAAVALRVKADGAQSYEPVSRFDQAQNRFVALPIDLGPPTDQVFLIMFGTGMRNLSSLAAAAAAAAIGGTNAELLYVGAQGEFVGLDQVTARLPRSLIGRGEMDVALTVDGQTANIARVAVAGNQTCNYAIAPASQSFSAGAGTGSVNVTANNGCVWTATSNAGFITITSGASGNGNGVVNYSVAANTATSQRTGALTIAGQTFTVTQAAAAPLAVIDRRLTGGPIPAQCAPPPAKNSFAPTDGQAYLWTLVSGAKIGDLARWEFVQSNGTVYSTSEYTVAFNDSVCFWGGINIAGTQAASLPGNWQARLLYNGALLLTENFTITAAAAPFSSNQRNYAPAAFSGGGQARPR
ncbi:MAG: choice-of-anchor D domain-containing protein [Blastocatellales bacterium]